MVLAPKTYTLLCGCFAALGSILFGYDLSVVASVIVSPNFLVVTDNPSADYTGFIVSALTLGAFCGCIPASLLADAFSRRTAIFAGAWVFILGGVLQTAAQNKGMVLAGRFFAGFAIGMLSLLAPLYQSEIAHPSLRGRLTTLQQFFLGIGAFIAGWITYGLTKSSASYGTPMQWRLALGLQMLPCVPLILMIYIFPESPRWLMIKGREEESLQTLARLHARGDTTDAFVVAEFHEMRESVRREQEVKTGWKQCFNEYQSVRKIMLGVILQFSVQMTGVSALQYYSPTIFAAIGFGVSTTLMLQSINTVLGLLGEFACVMFIDKTGRRWPMIIGNIICGMTFLVATVIQANFAKGGGSHGQGYAFVAMTWIFNFAFSACIGPLSWAYPVEILDTGIRAKGTALTSMSCWISNFMIGQVSPKAFETIGWRYYIVFAVCGFSNAAVIWLFFPETARIPLEHMKEHFEKTPLLAGFSKYKYIPKNPEAEMIEADQAGHIHGGLEKHDSQEKAEEYMIEKI